MDDDTIEGDTVVDRPVETPDLVGEEKSSGGGRGGGDARETDDLVGE